MSLTQTCFGLGYMLGKLSYLLLFANVLTLSFFCAINRYFTCSIFIGSAWITGPAVGAWLYDAGGFMLPFLVVGSISTTLSVLLIVTIPPHVSNSSANSQEVPSAQTQNTQTQSSCGQDVENSTNSDCDVEGDEVTASLLPNGTTTAPHHVQLGYEIFIILKKIITFW